MELLPLRNSLRVVVSCCWARERERVKHESVETVTRSQKVCDVWRLSCQIQVIFIEYLCFIPSLFCVVNSSSSSPPPPHNNNKTQNQIQTRKLLRLSVTVILYISHPSAHALIIITLLNTQPGSTTVSYI